MKIYKPHLLLLGVLAAAYSVASFASAVELGDRPLQLVAAMDDSPLKQKLLSCDVNNIKPSKLAIGHRGAPLQYPEHTRESYVAAANQGAGIVECDVTFTKDKALVCRHAQCDLHTTTNILSTPLAAKCSKPFSPAEFTPQGIMFREASAKCCASDLTLAEFKTLKGKTDNFNLRATNLDELYPASDFGTLMTHSESIALFKQLSVAMTPELKSVEVELPYQNMSRQDLANKLIDEYKEAGVDLADVYPQSFHWKDVEYWQQYAPELTDNLVALDGRYQGLLFNHRSSIFRQPSMSALKERGITTIAPPLWMLLEAEDGKIVPSSYAKAAKDAGLNMITWTLERSGDLRTGGGWYYQSLNGYNPSGDYTPLELHDGRVMEVLDVLVNDIGVTGIFSDWPATVAFFDHCNSASIAAN